MADGGRGQSHLAARPPPRHHGVMTVTPALTLLSLLFALLVLAEPLVPARAAARGRWPVNLALGVGNALLTRLLGAAGPVAAATWAGAHDVGLFNAFALPVFAVMPLVIIALDLAIYGQHRALHRWAWGWALHRLHHADADFDVTTGVRFHPGEALVSMLWKSLCVIALGAPVAAVLAFEAYLAAGSLIEHANVRLPARTDAALRRIWVTPAMHRVHHSAHGDDHDHNFGFAIALWDRWFGSYRAAASGPNIGLSQARDAG
jgi:sterol desaturase/sphingolipid hydroxylase (fatty acid hydroxylase superfamily)